MSDPGGRRRLSVAAARARKNHGPGDGARETRDCRPHHGGGDPCAGGHPGHGGRHTCARLLHWKRRMAVAEPAAARRRLPKRLLSRHVARLARHRQLHPEHEGRRRHSHPAQQPQRPSARYHLHRRARLGGRPAQREASARDHLPLDRRWEDLGSCTHRRVRRSGTRRFCEQFRRLGGRQHARGQSARP